MAPGAESPGPFQCVRLVGDVEAHDDGASAADGAGYGAEVCAVVGAGACGDVVEPVQNAGALAGGEGRRDRNRLARSAVYRFLVQVGQGAGLICGARAGDNLAVVYVASLAVISVDGVGRR